MNDDDVRSRLQKILYQNLQTTDSAMIDDLQRRLFNEGLDIPRSQITNFFMSLFAASELTSLNHGGNSEIVEPVHTVGTLNDLQPNVSSAPLKEAELLQAPGVGREFNFDVSVKYLPPSGLVPFSG